MVYGVQLQRAGSYESALSQFTNAVRFANDASESARSLARLGSVYQDLGQPEAAEKAYLRALKTDPTLGEAMNDLSSLYFDTRQYAKAETLIKRCLAHGAAPLVTARLRGNVAAIYQAERRYSEAEENYAAALRDFESISADLTPDMASVLFNVASLRLETGALEEAARYSQRALAIWETTLGTQHPTYAEGLAQLALIYADEGRTKDAEKLWIRSCGVLEARLGAGHETALRVLRAYSAFLERSGQKAAAKRIRKQIEVAKEASRPALASQYTVDYRELSGK
jgi:tetratricopeptide (TPR) repeat protein